MYIYTIHLNQKPFELSVSLFASSISLSLSLSLLAVNTVESLPNGWHSRGASGDEQLQQRRDLHIAEEDGKATTHTHTHTHTHTQSVDDTLLEFQYIHIYLCILWLMVNYSGSIIGSRNWYYAIIDAEQSSSVGILPICIIQ